VKHISLEIDGVVLITPKVYCDERGYFFESFNQECFNKLIGSNEIFNQDNHSYSKKGVLRGMHLQKDPHAQGKLVRVIRGEIFDVALDLRPLSKTFKKYISVTLSEKNQKQLWIPPGFAHGFIALSDSEVIYKATNFYNKASEVSINPFDESLGIKWPIKNKVHLSEKDRNGINIERLF
jgi:dTDP-4-dehydrorhamnose 3,5-epimerase